MRILRALASLTAIVLMAELGTAVASAETPSQTADDFKYAGCSSYSVSPAPTGEKDSHGQPIVPTPAAGAKWMPVILVHGWTGDPSSFRQPANLFGDGGDGGAPLGFTASITGRLQSIPGVAVYDFDYSEYASRWVTDVNIGPKLARAIECLTDHYGRKASVVAHSMGGLATRFALAQKDSLGHSISARVAQVSTFGTPNTGSDFAAAVARVAGNATSDVLAGKGSLAEGVMYAAWAFVQACGREYTAGTSAATGLCSAIPSFLTSLDSDGARALRTGSSELAALPPWPSGVPVQAVEGTIKLKGPSLFGMTLDTDPSLNIGDLPVANTSAVNGASSTVNDPCSLKVFGREGSLQYVQDGNVQSGAVSKAKLLESPCFHGNLMRTLNGVNPVVSAISTSAKDLSATTLAGGGSGTMATSQQGTDETRARDGSTVYSSGAQQIYIYLNIDTTYSMGPGTGVACDPVGSVYCLLYRLKVQVGSTDLVSGCHYSWTFSPVGGAPIDRGMSTTCDRDVFVGEHAARMPAGDYMMEMKVVLDDGSTSTLRQPIKLVPRY